MNTIGTGTLHTVQKAAITADVAALLQDTVTATSVVVDSVTAASFDAARGTSAPSTAQVSTTGWMSDLALREIVESGGAYQAGDRRLLVPSADFTTAPEVGATFRAGSDRYAVLTSELDPLGLFYELIGRQT